MCNNRRTISFLLFTALFRSESFLSAAVPGPDASAVAGRAISQITYANEMPIKGAVRAVTRASDGTLVVGSNTLAVFDGSKWEKVDVPGAYGFRALAPVPLELDPQQDSVRVYIGAIGTVGYIERTPAGTWQFVSLADFLRAAGLPNPGDIWFARSIGHSVLFVTTDHVLRWKPKLETFEVWSLPSGAHLQGFSDRKAVWVYQEQVGLLEFTEDGEPRVAVADRDLPEKPVTWMTPVSDEARGYFVGTSNAAYHWDGQGRFERLAELSDAVRVALPNSVVSLGDGRIAIGTLNAGVILADEKGTILSRITGKNGLEGDSVYALAGEGDRIWVGSENGLTEIEAIGRATLFDRQGGLDAAAGAPRKVIFHDGSAYPLTMKLLFKCEMAKGGGSDLRPLLSQQPVLWDATVAAGRLWIGAFGGLWRADERSAEHVHYIASDVVCVARSKRVPEGVLFLDRYRLKALIPSPHGGWLPKDLGVDVDGVPVSLLEDSEGDIWVSTMAGDVSRFGWRPPVKQRAEPSAGASDEMEPGRLFLRAHYKTGAKSAPASLALAGDRVFSLTEEGIEAMDDSGTGFKEVPELSRFMGIAVASFAPPGPGQPRASDSIYWLVQPKELAGIGSYAVIRTERGRAAGSLEWNPVTVPGIEALGQVVGISGYRTTAGTTLWLSGSRGFLRIDVNPSAPAPPRTRWRVIRTNERDFVPPVPATQQQQFEPEVHRMEFRFAAGAPVAAETAFYRTRLDGVDPDWTPPARESVREFNGLAPGSYIFAAKALDRFGREGPKIEYRFMIAAPWWRRMPAIVGYGALLLLAGFGVAQWRVRRLRKQNERLNRLVSDRTRELELSNAAKTEFLENISHEIRNPLNGLTGLLTLLREDRLGPRERELAKSLRAVAGTMTRVFEEVLGFSKLEYGYGRIDKRPFLLRLLLEDVVALFAAIAEQQKCTLQVIWPEEFVDGFEGDEPKIKTIISNFVANALKYAPGTPIEISVQSDPKSETMVDLFIEVADRGPGVRLEEQELIFNKFVRGSNAKGKQVTGAGLGLATCRALARLMNGNVGIHSEPGQGSAFFFGVMLPRADPTSGMSVPAGSAHPEKPAAPTGNRLPGLEAALIVEDEPYNQAVLEGIALELGFRPEVAGDGEQALVLLRQREYSVVFLDWELPGAKGDEVALAMRNNHHHSFAPIILATTAFDSDEIQAKCRAAGMDGFLLKPYDADKVRRELDRARARREGREPLRERADAEPDNSSEVLNLAAFSHYARSRPDHAANAGQIYRQAIDSESDSLLRALAADDVRAIRSSAHRLRALGGLISATAVNENASRLEDLAKREATGEINAQARELLAACEALKQRLE